MKNLLYKELKLSMHPVVWSFIFLFPLLELIPSYPICVTSIYVAAAYPILFLGAKNGQQNNDIFYSSLLPVRKKDIVLARIIMLFIIQTIPLVLMLILSPLANYLQNVVISDGGSAENVGLTLNGLISYCAFNYIAFSIYDTIYLPLYYRNAKSVASNTFFGILVFALVLTLLTIIFPMTFSNYYAFFCLVPIWRQIIYLVVALVIYLCVHIALLKICTKLFEKVDL